MPAWLLPAIGMALSSAGALKQIFSDPVSGRMESWLDYLENRAKHGISGAERAEIDAIYGPEVMRGATQGQNAIASALASRGTSNSSQADMAIADVWGRAAGVLPAIKAKADLAARTGAQGQYNDLLGYTDQLKEQSATAGWGALGGALGEGLGQIQDILYPSNDMEDLLRLIYGDQMLPDLNAPFGGTGSSYEPNLWG